MAKKEITVKCPQCAKQFSYYSSEYRPFCGEKCKQVDLGHWLTETYALPSQTPLSERDFEKVIEEQESKIGGYEH